MPVIATTKAIHRGSQIRPSKRRLWANGAIATLYNAGTERATRPAARAAWADEVAKWRYDDAWDQLMFGSGSGTTPLLCNHPAPEAVRTSRADGTWSPAPPYANRANLAAKFVDRLSGTGPAGRQELHGELLTLGARSGRSTNWTSSASRMPRPPPDRVAVDGVYRGGIG